MILGFTGTRHGMSPVQIQEFKRLIKRLALNHSIEGFHHGDCLGADAQAHDWIIRYLPRCPVYIHPSNMGNLRAYRRGTYIYLPAAPLVRNRRIVDQCTFLVACPNTREEEEVRSGTWATVRYARRVNRPLRIVLP